MPWLSGQTVNDQHDGARPRTGHRKEALIATFGNVGTWRFTFVTHPAQSPDLNILDLGLLHSLKSKVHQLKFHATNLVTLIEKVRQAYNQYDANTLDHIWVHLYDCSNCILTQMKGISTEHRMEGLDNVIKGAQLQ